VRLPNSECHFRFGNHLHKQTNSVVIASALGRLILFGAPGKDCIYFDRPDYSNSGLSLTSYRIMCNLERVSSGKYAFRPPEEAWPLRCNNTVEEFDSRKLIEFFRLEHQNSGALFQNYLVQERLHNLPYPKNFDNETQFLQRYEIFGVASKIVFPIRWFVKNYSIQPDPKKFDIVLGVHLRHLVDIAHRGLVIVIDQAACR